MLQKDRGSALLAINFLVFFRKFASHLAAFGERQSTSFVSHHKFSLASSALRVHLQLGVHSKTLALSLSGTIVLFIYSFLLVIMIRPLPTRALKPNHFASVRSNSRITAQDTASRKQPRSFSRLPAAVRSVTRAAQPRIRIACSLPARLSAPVLPEPWLILS